MPPSAVPGWFADAWGRCGLRLRYACAHGRIHRGPYCERQGRDHWTIYAVFGGELSLRSNHFDLRLMPSTMAVIPGLTHFREQWLDEAGAAACIAGFDVLRSTTVVNPLAHLSLPRAVAVPDGDAFTDTCRCLIAVAEEAPGRTPQGWPQVHGRGLLDALLWTWIEAGFADGSLLTIAEAALPVWLESLVDRCMQRCARADLDVAELVAWSGYSAAHVHDCFRRYLATTPQRFLRQQRIDLACRLLQHEAHCSIAEIACRCGYQHQARFHRHFRELTGTTPRRYRVTRLAGPTMDPASG